MLVKITKKQDIGEKKKVECLKCGVIYKKAKYGFYIEKRKVNEKIVRRIRKPCKNCIKKYNNQPEQKEKRKEYQTIYQPIYRSKLKREKNHE